MILDFMASVASVMGTALSSGLDVAWHVSMSVLLQSGGDGGLGVKVCNGVKALVPFVGLVMLVSGFLFVGSWLGKGIMPEWAQQQQGTMGKVFLGGAGLLAAGSVIPAIASALGFTTAACSLI